jgi:signal transduction histidine kinase
LYCAICPPAALLIGVAFWPMWRDRPLLALGSVVLSMALLSAGILLLDEPGQQSSAIMLLGSSVLLAAGWLNIWRVGPLPLVSVPASPAGTILAAWAMFCYPNSPHERRAGNRFFLTMLGCILAGLAFCVAVSRSQWYGFSAHVWWPTLYAHRGLYTAASGAVDVAGIGFAVAYMLLWIARWRGARGISRTLAQPVAVAASITCAITIVELAAGITAVSGRVMDDIYTVEAFFQIGVPAAFVVSVLRRRFARTRIIDLLMHLRGPARATSITEALRNVFEDPALEIVDWAPGTLPRGGSGGYTAAHPPEPPDAAQPPQPAQPREPREPPHAARGVRLPLPITSSSGERLAVIMADPSLSASDDLVRAAVAASSFALENAQLEAALADQLQEVHESRLRIIQAGVAERRRLERDLHDGTQQRLLALKIMLAAAESDTTDDKSRAIISRIRSELAQVIDELRDLAHGIHPAALGQVGLEQAIKSMAERYPIPIDVDLPAGRFGEAAELTAYYLIAESITNAIKHARAQRIQVRGAKSGGWLRITVSDDGDGGANAAAGSGISGILDRVRGIGGEAYIDSPPGHGTQVKARIPCA